MNLLENFKTPCVMMEQKTIPDGEGGETTVWSEGVSFDAAITFHSSLEARKAEKEGVTSLYTVTVEKGLSLKHHDVLKRLPDRKIFRVTSDEDDVQTPQMASFQFAQVTAEEWRLP